MPQLRRVAVLSNAAGPNHAAMVSNVKAAGLGIGLELLIYDALRDVDFDRALAQMTNNRVEALFVFGDSAFSIHRARLAGRAIENRLPLCTRTGRM